MMQKVSVIVPIYKVEKYLRRCVDSILEQTYTNLEIILINDGSPDQCGEIIEEYARKDSRIIAVHKENGGLSDARNVGITFVTGDFTLFLDSDDWLERNMIDTLIEISQTYKADVVQSAFFYAYADHLLYDDRLYLKDDPPLILNNQELMYELVKNDVVKNFAWGKLYRTKLINGLPFKKGVLFEDVFWAHHVMKRVEKYVIVHQPLCYYFQRDDSIVANYSLENLAILEGLKERHRFVEKYYPDLVNESYKLILKTCLTHYNMLVLHRKKDYKGIQKRKIRSFIMENYEGFSKAVQRDKQLRQQFRLFTIHPYINISFLTSRKLLRKLRLLRQPADLERIELSYRV
ncbi:glycosyltransferase family 2 protein [Bacillus niameyensis]|uniref:glycosyltransferase family 2 protein n=1 Tax=Bacillus niameyensis TaxID=1522308 RepID=UPI000784A37A|nr:glycosyltransferase [Bacillus niameyensis]